ncbi:putative membrane protein YeiB [Thermocatellispora tengchongensis]|uniref:Putative membrane protein YeiB n=1 Tax=Thermocatellispora tengchongensis TaxID=1073253 RepID=A0A840NSG1_9ACTN|nr:heparan-alpha-glucosaminide N-acetyltransferase domain-containing protein [Thermocatellispora tengchongensis]MBB5131604.1 putative membrane protein YeiB [Thermocatellispora tengchongensis]
MMEFAPVGELAEVTAAEQGGSSSGGRILGIDLARALAVFGMFAVHVGPDPESVSRLAGVVLWLAQGRSAALFATLAGLSLVLLAGRVRPVDSRRRVRRVAVRGGILLVLGTLLTMLGTPISVIIPYYGVFFLLALPFLWWRASALAVAALVVAAVGPVVALAPMVIPGEWLDTFAAYDPVNMMSGRGFIDLLLAGAFPAVSWMAYVLAGMALGRMDLASTAARVRLAGAGAGLCLAGYGVSWLVVNVFTGVGAEVAQGSAAAAAAGSEYIVQDQGSVAARLLVALPHSNTFFEIAGNIGVAILVIVAASAAMDALPRLRRLAAPVVAVGAMSLTAYVAHLLVIRFVEAERYLGSPTAVLVAFVLTITVFAAVWSRFFRRGPLEYLLYVASGGRRRAPRHPAPAAVS